MAWIKSQVLRFDASTHTELGVITLQYQGLPACKKIKEIILQRNLTTNSPEIMVIVRSNKISCKQINCQLMTHCANTALINSPGDYDSSTSSHRDLQIKVALKDLPTLLNSINKTIFGAKDCWCIQENTIVDCQTALSSTDKEPMAFLSRIKLSNFIQRFW